MNIFKLAQTPYSSAQMHCDKHVSKMILESAQMLCTVLWINEQSAPYKPVHPHHPCTVWAGESLENWLWLKELVAYLNEEFCWRYDRTSNHKSAEVVKELSTPFIESKGLQQHPQCMPDEYKTDCVYESYRQFYIGEKAGFAQWNKTTEAPAWWPEGGE